MTHLTRLVLIALASILCGCAAQMQLPAGFLQLTEGDQFRAVTGDDARIAVRDFEDPNGGSRSFWRDAVEFDFVQQRGYELVAKGEVKNRAGALGDWFECAANVGGERVGYLVAVWATGKNIKVVEFAARAEVFKARVESVKAALVTVQG